MEVLDGAAWRAAADAPPDLEPEPAGLPAFGAAVVEHLLRHRGLPADPDAVLATAGSTSAVAELAGILPMGARVAVEEPGYRRARWALAAAARRDRGGSRAGSTARRARAPLRRSPAEAGVVLGYAGPPRADLECALPDVTGALRGAV